MPILNLTQVNSVGATADGFSQIAALQNGNFVVVAPLRDQIIQFQLIDPFGEPIGPVISISGEAYPEISQYANPTTSVTTLADGRFLIAWLDDRTPYNTLGEIFNADGSVAIPQFTLTNPSSSGSQYGYAVTALANGGFDALFTQALGDGSITTISQAYNSDGSVNGAPVPIVLAAPINASTSSFVTTLANGSVAVASEVNYSYVTGVVGHYVDEVETEVISASGVTTAVRISDQSTNLAPQIAALKDGDYVVAWEHISGPSDATFIQGVILASDGVTEHGSFLYPVAENDSNEPIALTRARRWRLRARLLSNNQLQPICLIDGGSRVQC